MEIWGSHSDNYEHYYHLECDTVYVVWCVAIDC
jgi:hypothetical protein